MEENKIGLLFIDKHGELRIVMEELGRNIVRSINVTNMNIDGIIIREDLTSIFSGHGNFQYRRNKVIFKP